MLEKGPQEIECMIDHLQDLQGGVIKPGPGPPPPRNTCSMWCRLPEVPSLPWLASRRLPVQE